MLLIFFPHTPQFIIFSSFSFFTNGKFVFFPSLSIRRIFLHHKTTQTTMILLSLPHKTGIRKGKSTNKTLSGGMTSSRVDKDHVPWLPCHPYPAILNSYNSLLQPSLCDPLARPYNPFSCNDNLILPILTYFLFLPPFRAWCGKYKVPDGIVMEISSGLPRGGGKVQNSVPYA